MAPARKKLQKKRPKKAQKKVQARKPRAVKAASRSSARNVTGTLKRQLGKTRSTRAPKLVEGADKLAEMVVARLAETSDTVTPRVMEGVDKIVEMLTAKVVKTTGSVPDKVTEEVDKIAELVAAKLAQTSTAQQSMEAGLEKIAELVAAKVASSAAAAPQKASPKQATAAEPKVSASTFKHVALDWKEVYYTNCPMVSASNIDQELGWAREEFKKIDVTYRFLRSHPENNWYPHYIHNMDNLIRFGGLFPPISVHADIRRTVLLGLTWVYEGGCMLVRTDDDIFRMEELRGKKIGLTKSLNTIKNDWWRIQEHQGIELMLRINGMTTKDVEIVEFPYPDDWYDKPEMMGPPMDNASELWLKRDHKHDLAFRPLETALEQGVVDAIYTQTKPFQHLQEETSKFKAIEDLSRYPDWTLQVCNQPTTATCTVEMAEKHPELVVAWLKAMIKVGRWANEHKHAAATILDKQTFYLDVEDTYRGIKDVDIVPNLSPKNLKAVEIGKNFMFTHGYMKNDFDVQKWAAPQFLEQAAKELIEERWHDVTAEKLPMAAGRIG